MSDLDELKKLAAEFELVRLHNEAKWLALHQAYQAGLLDPDEDLKKRVYKLLGGILGTLSYETPGAYSIPIPTSVYCMNHNGYTGLAENCPSCTAVTVSE